MNCNVRVIYIRNPPVNALSFPTLSKLREEIQEALDEETVDAILLTGDENCFSSGADLKTLDANYHKYGAEKATEAYITAYATGENLAPFVYFLDQATKPVIALISGICYGGGLEVALGCHYRICTETAAFRLPEVLVGIVPGALGTQYLPRLMDFPTAIELAVSAKQIDAKVALKKSLVDELISSRESFGAAVFQALTRVQQLLAGDRRRLRRTSELPVKTPVGDAMVMVARATSLLPPVHKGGLAQRAVLEALLGCVLAGNAFVRGALWESEISRSIVSSREAHALRYVFLSEKAASQYTAGSSSSAAAPVSVKCVGVVGAGLMGSGIAASLCWAKYKVTIVDANEEAIERGRKTLSGILASMLSKAKKDPAQLAGLLAVVTFSVSFEALRTCDLVVEAVFEDLHVKTDVFQKLSAVCSNSCILCTNTSSLDIDAIAAVCVNPSRVAGMHFFSPAHVMKLVEVVQAASTDAASLRAISAVVKRMNKVGIVVKNAPGFVGNRMVFNYVLESMLLLEEGASVHAIDALMVDFGFPMGPFQMQDLAGLDVGYLIRREHGLLTGSAETRYSKIGDELYHRGRLGCKNGKGFYRYEGSSRTPIVDPAVDEIVAGFVDIALSPPSDEEIIQRLVFPIINEGLRVLSERGVVSGRPGDVDMVFVLGYGFPPYKGGPLFYAQCFPGLRRVHEVLAGYAARWPTASYFSPCRLLTVMMQQGVSIFDLQSNPSLLEKLLRRSSPFSRL